MTTKLKIDLTQGLLEVEGSESFVKSIYADFKTHFAGIEIDEDKKPKRRTRKSPAKAGNAPPRTKPAEQAVAEAAAPLTVPAEPAPKKAPSPAQTYTYLENLDLKATRDRPSLVEFMDAKFPLTNEERNVVFLYYLRNLRKLKSIMVDHIYTCYRVARIRAPLNIENSMNQRGWIRVAKNGRLTLTAAGKKYVEDQLPKKLK